MVGGQRFEDGAKARSVASRMEKAGEAKVCYANPTITTAPDPNISCRCHKALFLRMAIIDSQWPFLHGSRDLPYHYLPTGSLRSLLSSQPQLARMQPLPVREQTAAQPEKQCTPA